LIVAQGCPKDSCGEAKAEAEEGKRVIRLINAKNINGKDPLKCAVYN